MSFFCDCIFISHCIQALLYDHLFMSLELGFSDPFFDGVGLSWDEMRSKDKVMLQSSSHFSTNEGIFSVKT